MHVRMELIASHWAIIFYEGYIEDLYLNLSIRFQCKVTKKIAGSIREDLQTFMVPSGLHSSLVEKSLRPSSRENHNTHFISTQRPQNRSVYETISKK
jgi:hypothetical protein